MLIIVEFFFFFLGLGVALESPRSLLIEKLRCPSMMMMVSRQEKYRNVFIRSRKTARSLIFQGLPFAFACCLIDWDGPPLS